MNISASSAAKSLSLLPFGYFAATRIKGIRDLAYLVATSWVPAVWLLVRLGQQNATTSVANFALGYLAFISIYELGYLVNDAWDAKRGSGGRDRLSFRLGPAYVLAFLALRLAIWAGIGIATHWIAEPFWLAGFAALLIAFAQHNIVRQPGLRVASFFELATLRFTLPILGALPAAVLAPTISVAMILYAMPRLLAYMESKDMLRLEQRRDPGFGFALLLSFLPLMLLLAYLFEQPVIAELSAYFLAVYAAGWRVFRGIASARLSLADKR